MTDTYKVLAQYSTVADRTRAFYQTPADTCAAISNISITNTGSSATNYGLYAIPSGELAAQPYPDALAQTSTNYHPQYNISQGQRLIDLVNHGMAFVDPDYNHTSSYGLVASGYTGDANYVGTKVQVSGDGKVFAFVNSIRTANVDAYEHFQLTIVRYKPTGWDTFSFRGQDTGGIFKRAVNATADDAGQTWQLDQDTSIAIDYTGETIVVSQPYSKRFVFSISQGTVTHVDSGSVHAFKWNGSSYQHVGTLECPLSFSGQAAARVGVQTYNTNLGSPTNAKFGKSLAISDDGLTLFVSDQYKNVNDSWVGAVHVYKFDQWEPNYYAHRECVHITTSSYTRTDGVVVSQNAGSYYFGYSMTASKNGRYLVIGDPSYSTSNAANCGAIYVIDISPWSNSNGMASIFPKATALDSTNSASNAYKFWRDEGLADEYMGLEVATSANGNVIATKTYHNNQSTSKINTYTYSSYYDETVNEWVPSFRTPAPLGFYRSLWNDVPIQWMTDYSFVTPRISDLNISSLSMSRSGLVLAAKVGDKVRLFSANRQNNPDAYYVFTEFASIGTGANNQTASGTNVLFNCAIGGPSEQNVLLIGAPYMPALNDGQGLVGIKWITETDISYAELSVQNKHAFIFGKTINPGETHMIDGGITLDSFDALAIDSTMNDVVVSVFGTEITENV